MSRWWEGMDWLKRPPEEWPKSNVTPDFDIINSEKGRLSSAPISSDNTKRIEWPLAAVMELYPSKDGSIRTGKSKMKSGEFLRPVIRLIPLEVTQKLIR
ncbi:hypothetical protein TNIN_71591 [Trichonephila inaurata madagascariensis]|uniref:DUF5641 domain-containing protein n=1 Tax=Trichonephila inaurata madagascariensis TaxID=2747483 RepID=A0A8X6MKW7_9ARAC|nr:hypothetical protein TNIN_71591 [Trichonephila inaurata madagascariensis]